MIDVPFCLRRATGGRVTCRWVGRRRCRDNRRRLGRFHVPGHRQAATPAAGALIVTLIRAYFAIGTHTVHLEEEGDARERGPMLPRDAKSIGSWCTYGLRTMYVSTYVRLYTEKNVSLY